MIIEVVLPILLHPEVVDAKNYRVETKHGVRDGQVVVELVSGGLLHTIGALDVLDCRFRVGGT